MQNLKERKCSGVRIKRERQLPVGSNRTDTDSLICLAICYKSRSAAGQVVGIKIFRVVGQAMRERRHQVWFRITGMEEPKLPVRT